MSLDRYDVILVGTGAGGGTLLHRLAPTGLRILVLERGTFLPREPQNWDPTAVLTKDRYHNSEKWLDKDGREFKPGTGYWVGGNTKVYGAAILRLRERDFEEVRHAGGVSPAWPLRYADFEPYYGEAERLYGAHGLRGEDPTDPPASAPYPHPPVSHEPVLERYSRELARQGLRPFHVPLAIRLNESDRSKSPCVRCATCDGFPCLVDAKGDADVTCVRPTLASHGGNVTLLTGAKALRLLTSPSGREVGGVEAVVGGERRVFRAGTVVVSCGAIQSAALLLRSANGRHPNGLGNSSGCLGRNFMRHQNAILFDITPRENATVFQKTLAVNDFYWGEPGFPYPMGHVSLVGKSTKEMLALGAPPFAPAVVLKWMAARSVDWWLTAEDLPDPANRVRLEGDRIVVEYRDNNVEAFDRLIARWKSVLRRIHGRAALTVVGKLPIAAVGHQVGTCRFGDDPTTSVLDPDCRVHDVDNLYVVDGSFFPSSAAVNPSLTIMANALRVGDHLRLRLGATETAAACSSCGSPALAVAG
jgi:choline dehydrogenase-like flavoprotein